MANTYTYRQTVRVRGTFYNGSNQLVDPPDVRIDVRAPDGTVTTYLIEDTPTIILRSSLGIYTAIIYVNMPGRWMYAWSSETLLEDGSSPAKEGYFDVQASAFAAA